MILRYIGIHVTIGLSSYYRALNQYLKGMSECMHVHTHILVCVVCLWKLERDEVDIFGGILFLPC